jgi:cytochrome c-type biogenesis protein CcmH/NrfG
MIGEILAIISRGLTVFSQGHKVIETITDFRPDLQAARQREVRKDFHAERLYALEVRLEDLESQTKEQDAQTAELRQTLTDAARTTEALAHRLRTVFWIATVGCALAFIGVVLAAVALTRTIR